MILLLGLQCVPVVHAQRGGVHPDPEPDTPDSPPKSPPVTPGRPASPGGDGGSIGVAGAITEGKDPQVSSNDDEIDIEDIGEKINDLIEDISSLVEALTSTTTSTSTDDSGSPFITISETIKTTQRAFPYAASGCTAAQAAYSTCSAAATTATISGSTGNFTALPRKQQAGCLCNASPNIDFNQNMQDCYNWAHVQSGIPNATLFQSYASVIANATSLCAPDPCQPTSGGGDPINAIASFEACANAQPPSPTPPPSSTPSVTPPTSDGAASQHSRGFWYLLPMVLWIASVGGLS